MKERELQRRLTEKRAELRAQAGLEPKPAEVLDLPTYQANTEEDNYAVSA